MERLNLQTALMILPANLLLLLLLCRFDPMFWLHHCNIDRLYQAYLEAHPDSLEEMSAVQRKLQEQQGEPNRFEAVL